MSQQQTVRITTTETSHSSALIINTGYLSTPPGILKLLQFVNTIFPALIFHLSNFDHFAQLIYVFCVWCRLSESQILGIICVVLVTINFNDHSTTSMPELFFYLMTTTFLICTTILLISCLFSWSTGGIISKTIYVSNHTTFRNKMFKQFLCLRSC